MWRLLLDLCRAVRRPLVVPDYETCGLTGEPPVEMCFLVFAPWSPPEADPDTQRARALLPGIAADLTCAATTRLNPRCRIPAEATAIHGITDVDVAGCPAFDDLEVQSYVRSLATGDAALDDCADCRGRGTDGGGDDCKACGGRGCVVTAGPAVWVGHNLAGFDLPHMLHWGHLSKGTDLAALDVIDTDRLVQRLASEHPHPLVVDPNGAPWVTGSSLSLPPCVGHGLCPEVFRHTLEGARYTLLGELPDGTAHGAVADACLSARVLHACLELWAPLWSVAANPDKANPADALGRLLAALAATPTDHRTGAKMVAWDGWLSTDMTKTQAAVNLATLTRFARGKHKGKTLAAVAKGSDRSYLDWLMRQAAFPGVDGEQWFAPASRALVAEALRR